ncbi:class I SAM-dependent methyltransferase [Streptomyces sp. NPDC001276]|uniref:class I SAM-dependent methyltransferase n=1 Tax=Streptomyces sp. NPDC001276 TaxID=3364555 RepID=UPI00368D8072
MLTAAELLKQSGSAERGWRLAEPLSSDSVDASQYFSHPRPEIVQVVPEAACSILELGCAAGAMGSAIKKRQNCSYIGIEINSEAASMAACSLDAVLVGDVETGPLPFPDQSIDCIICADIIEHLADPWQILRELRRIIQPGGTVVVSVPNIQNVDIVQALVNGRWDYLDAGILDRTHLRFFTRSTFEESLIHAGFTVTGCNFTMLPQHASLVDFSNPASKRIKAGKLIFEDLNQAELMGLAAYQWIFSAKSPE